MEVHILVLLFLILTFLWTLFTFLFSLYKQKEKKSWSALFYIIGAIIAEYISFLTVLLFLPFRISDEKVKRKRSDNAANIPNLLIHGYLHNRGAFTALRFKFRKDGIENIFSITMKPTFASIEQLAEQVDEKVNKIISETNFQKINLITHSMGGLVARYYMQELGGAEKVNFCITLACPHHGTKSAAFALGEDGRDMRPGSVFLKKLNEGSQDINGKIISLWSDFDNMIFPHENAIIDGARNIRIEYLGHVAFLFSPRVYRIIKECLGSKL